MLSILGLLKYDFAFKSFKGASLTFVTNRLSVSKVSDNEERNGKDHKLNIHTVLSFQ